MPTYAIGDIQGCYETLTRLLEQIDFDPARDRLWLAGDLVNRGPSSLQVLRWARALSESMQDRFVTVLGNHDLHLLGVAAGLREKKKRDTFHALWNAEDRAPLLAWLRTRPLLHREDSLVLVHAGLLPAWTLEQAEQLAREAEAELRGEHSTRLLALFYEHDEAKKGVLGKALDGFTLLRACTADGGIDFDFKGSREAMPNDLLPWFEVPDRANSEATILFGHWAALGHYQAAGVVALDSGCVWGGSLTAYRLEDKAVFQEPLADDTRCLD